MNTKKHILFLIATIATICACDHNNFPAGPVESTNSLDTVDCSTMDIPAGAITVYKARKIGDSIGSGNTTEEEYLIKGLVKSFNESKHEDAINKYGNAYVYIHDSKKATTDFYGYQVMGMNGERFTSTEQIQIGDFIVIKGKITNYSGTIETEGKGAAQIVFSTNPLAYTNVEEDTNPTDTVDCSGWDIPEGSITVAKAREIGKALGSGNTSEEEYYIKGLVKGFNDKKHADAIASYGNAYVYIHDSEKATTDFYGYQVMGMNGARLTSVDQIQVGDFIVIKGRITNYNGTIETEGKGAAQIVFSTNPLAYE